MVDVSGDAVEVGVEGDTLAAGTVAAGTVDAGTLDAGTVDTVAAGGCAGSVADGAGTR